MQVKATPQRRSKESEAILAEARERMAHVGAVMSICAPLATILPNDSRILERDEVAGPGKLSEASRHVLGNR
jgi:hypothetical protein